MHAENLGHEGGFGTLSGMSGVFYCGDNLEILDGLGLIPRESVDLIYLDPPFNSKRTFNLVYKGSKAQEVAFKDYWSWEEAAPTFARLLVSPEIPPRLRELLRGLHATLKDDDSDLLAYVSMMAPRLIAMHGVLKETGSLYLHCDPTASHYLKTLLDAVFGQRNFLAEIVWKRYGAHGDSKRYGAIHDTILYYGKTNKAVFNKQFVPYTEEYAAYRFRHVDSDGRRYQEQNLSSPNPRPNLTYDYTASNGVTYKAPRNGWKVTRDRMKQLDREGRLHFPKKEGARLRLKMFLDESDGVPVQDLWTDIQSLSGTHAERVGYPTQKPVSLLQRIIASSSNEGDVVLDPFCGCGTTIEAAERMQRRWIGIDISHRAVDVTKKRFAKLDLDEPTLEWLPPDTAAAKALGKQSGLKFEAWALRKVRAVKRRKRDRGIDGEAFFQHASGVTHVLVSVKSGKLNPAMVRDLRGTIERERGCIGVLLSLREPSKEMKREATHAGFTDGPDGMHVPRLQLLTVEQMFGGQGIIAPGVNVTEMPRPTVPTGEPKDYGQLSLKLESVKPPAKTRPKRGAAKKRAAK